MNKLFYYAEPLEGDPIEQEALLYEMISLNEKVIELTEYVLAATTTIQVFLIITGIGISFAGAWLVWRMLRNLLNQYVWKGFNI